MLCLLPGSRRREIQLNLPGMLRVAGKLRERTPDLRVVIPHREQRRADLVHEILSDHDAGFAEVHVGPPGPWLAGARVVLAKSGTGSLEACLHGTPTVVVYALPHRLIRWLYTRLLSVPYFAAANLICGRQIVAEFPVAHGDEWNRVAEAVAELWHDDKTRERALSDLSVLRERLGGSGASARAAHAVRAFLSVITQKQAALA
jgi:lipid-A-disaccharide synthase